MLNNKGLQLRGYIKIKVKMFKVFEAFEILYVRP